MKMVRAYDDGGILAGITQRVPVLPMPVTVICGRPSSSTRFLIFSSTLLPALDEVLDLVAFFLFHGFRDYNACLLGLFISI